MDWVAFLTVVLLVFAVVMLLAGIFTAYFGSGKSRTVGIILLVAGLAVGAIWVYLTGYSGLSPFSLIALWDVVAEALIYIIAALIGAVAAVGIFLVAVMKS